jgi:hypothetical protein
MCFQLYIYKKYLKAPFSLLRNFLLFQAPSVSLSKICSSGVNLCEIEFLVSVFY